MLYVASKRGLPRKCARFVLFHPIKKHSFNQLVSLLGVPFQWLFLAAGFSAPCPNTPDLQPEMRG